MSEEFKSPILVTGTFTPGGTQDVNIISTITLPVSGTFFQALQPVSVASLPLPSGAATEATLSSRLASQGTTSAITRVASSTSSQQLIAANANRKMLALYNDSSGQQYIKWGTTASQTDFTVRMSSQSYYELPIPCYTGRLDVISQNNNGGIQVTELV